MQRAFLNWLRNGNNKDLYNSLLGLNPISFVSRFISPHLEAFYILFFRIVFYFCGKKFSIFFIPPLLA